MLPLERDMFMDGFVFEGVGRGQTGTGICIEEILVG